MCKGETFVDDYHVYNRQQMWWLAQCFCPPLQPASAVSEQSVPRRVKQLFHALDDEGFHVPTAVCHFVLI